VRTLIYAPPDAAVRPWQAAAEAAARERQRAHNHRRRQRARERSTAHIEALLQSLPPPGGLEASSSFVQLDAVCGAALPPVVDWDALPAAVRPETLGEDGCGPLPAGSTAAALALRVARKRAQVESFVVVLQRLLAAAPTSPCGRPWQVVDFGCGSGALALPLAALFPGCNFVGVDMLSRSVELLRQRAASAGLRNMEGVVSMIERYQVRRPALPLSVRVCYRHACWLMLVGRPAAGAGGHRTGPARVRQRN
jgi:SAM-dependent methyltransferase